ncbi:hypothetical protein L6164_022206 [Bauhinia variegata]|uniref:Uncharacterized protein n=1 Tax=Bauhinia variegata TaxID=167791 RepID=A0ACB9MHS9_BAUVA|nr:hypothetical protein L6164_022206 [Bauhinia variegata]
MNSSFSRFLFPISKGNSSAFSLTGTIFSCVSPFSVHSIADSSYAPFNKIQIQMDDTTFGAYVIGKDDAPGIVVLQEAWGVNFEIKNLGS